MQGATSAGASSASSSQSQVFFRYRGRDGVPVLTNVAEDVPRDKQDTAEIILMEPHALRWTDKVDGTSLGLGALAGFVLGCAASPLLRVVPRWGKYGLAASLAIGAMMLYLGWMRRSTGLGQGAVATPQALVQDAKRAVESMNARVRERDEELKKIELETRK